RWLLPLHQSFRGLGSRIAPITEGDCCPGQQRRSGVRDAERNMKAAGNSMIRASPEITDRHREVLRDVLHEVHRIDRTVRDLLSYAKPRPALHTTIHLPELAQRVVTMLRQSTKEGGPSITLDPADGIPGFTGD